MVAFALVRSIEALTSAHRSRQLRTRLDVDRMALAMLAAVQGGLLLSQVRRDTTPLEAAVDVLIEQLRSLGVR